LSNQFKIRPFCFAKEPRTKTQYQNKAKTVFSKLRSHQPSGRTFATVNGFLLHSEPSALVPLVPTFFISNIAKGIGFVQLAPQLFALYKKQRIEKLHTARF